MTSQSQQIRKQYEGMRVRVPETKTKAEALRVLGGANDNIQIQFTQKASRQSQHDGRAKLVDMF